MKWARWCENEGYEYQYIRGCVKPKFTPDRIYMSCLFTYYSKKYEQTISYYLKKFPNVQMIIGGVFPTLCPEWFQQFNNLMVKRVTIHQGICDEIEHLVPKYNVEVTDEKHDEKLDYRRNHKIVLYSSRGCVNKCGYCAVPKLEGDMKSFTSIQKYLDVARTELPNADTVVLYDNNFTEHEYFDGIVDELYNFGLPIDIHGLHTESFDDHKARQLSKMKWGSQGNPKSTAYIRFGFDKMKYKDSLYETVKRVVDHNIKAQIFMYALYNWTDTPDDFYERIKICKRWAEEFSRYIFLFPQRYEPLRALQKYSYIGKHWDEELVVGIRRMATFLHGFIQCSHTNYTWNWIGYTEDEFWNNVRRMGNNSKARLIKNNERT